MKSIYYWLLASLSLVSCHSNNNEVNTSNDAQPDTLHAVTLYGPTSYFNYRGQNMGFDYENLHQFANDEGMVLDLKIATSMAGLMKSLMKGESDLIAYPVPKIEEYSESVIYCGPKEITWQVLVQNGKEKPINDVTELVGKTIFVEKNSKYEYRLNNLNNELGGGINIIPISNDTLTSEDMLEMVDKGKIPYTMVDSDIAELNHSYYPHLNIGMKLSLEQFSSWATRKDNKSLAEKLNHWNKQKGKTDVLKNIYKKYFELSKQSPSITAIDVTKLNLQRGKSISPFDHLFKKYCTIPDYDWMLLAAIGYTESRFDHSQQSWAGAEGVMQIMPSTAQALEIEDISSPEGNIRGAAILLKRLDEALAEKVPDKYERQFFVIAAYNSGLGHIFDSIALAEKYGLDSTKWLGNVSEAALLKSKPQYYNDPVVKNGYFRGRETVEFVERVIDIYNYFSNFANEAV